MPACLCWGTPFAKLRPDITWYNVDPFYKNNIHKQAAADAPKNVKYFAQDITNPEASLKKLKAQRIYSYWMLPHLSVHSVKPAEVAAGVMWDLLAKDGVMRVGPDYPYRIASIKKDARVLKFSKAQGRAEVIHGVASVTRLPFWARRGQIFLNTTGMRRLMNVFLRQLTKDQMRRARRAIG